MNSEGVLEFNWLKQPSCVCRYLEKLKDRLFVCVCSAKVWARTFFQDCMFEHWLIFVCGVLDYTAVEDTDSAADIESLTASAYELVDNILAETNVAIPNDTTR